MSRLKTIPFDPADYLDDDVAVAIHLSAALAAGNASHFQEALGTVVRARGTGSNAEESGLGRENI
ncbi:DNA-binding protein [Stenotrophomonas hibiscicola]|uniref:helix-turn-helix domain-containing transcriptional regulator n=1 Tax=Stenotrophomonas hibiscicola TaxID=86189 RepID=UPI00320E77A6